MFYQRVGVYKSFSGVVDDTREGDAIADALGGGSAVIMQNHGLLTVGSSVDIACALFVQLERACEVHLLAAAAGLTHEIPHDVAVKTREYITADVVLWGNFQPLYQQMLAADPSFRE